MNKITKAVSQYIHGDLTAPRRDVWLRRSKEVYRKDMNKHKARARKIITFGNYLAGLCVVIYVFKEWIL